MILKAGRLIAAKATGKTIIPKALTPRPHQAEAIKKSFKHFKNNERGKMIMPCGTGKSLAAFWIARKLNAKSILIAVPSSCTSSANTKSMDQRILNSRH
jgi:predicted helicase